MDLAHLHLMMNHVPVMGVVFGFLVALIGGIARSRIAVRVGLIMLVAAGLIAVPVYLTGDSAEELVEHLPGVSEGIIDQHQSAATLSLAFAGISGALALLTLLFSLSLKPKANGSASALVRVRSLTPKVPGMLFVATMLVTLLGAASMIRTANLGGQIRHTEIRSRTVVAPAAETKGTERHERHGDDD